jgi:hypothetical protein
MIFPTAFILPFLAFLITPIMSAPIIGPRHLTEHPVDAGLEKRSPLFWGQHHGDASSAVTKRSFPDYSHLVARENAGSVLEARAFNDMGESALDKRTEGPTTVRLARRSIKVRAFFFMELISDNPLFHLNRPKTERFQEGRGEIEQFQKYDEEGIREGGAETQQFQKHGEEGN